MISSFLSQSLIPATNIKEENHFQIVSKVVILQLLLLSAVASLNCPICLGSETVNFQKITQNLDIRNIYCCTDKSHFSDIRPFLVLGRSVTYCIGQERSHTQLLLQSCLIF